MDHRQHRHVCENVCTASAYCGIATKRAGHVRPGGHTDPETGLSGLHAALLCKLICKLLSLGRRVRAQQADVLLDLTWVCSSCLFM